MIPTLALTCLLPTLWMASPTTWTQLEPGLDHALIRVEASPGLTSARMHVFRVDLRTHKLVPVDARRAARTRATVKELAEERPASVLVNGTYFDERERPLGLLVGDGDELNPLRKADWGVFHVSAGRAGLVHTRDWKKPKSARPDFAIQVGPRCVIDGQPVKLKPQVARRAVLGIQRTGHVLVAVSTAELLSSDLARVMAAPEAEGGLGCRDAVMLDGGGSAQLLARVGDRQWHVPGTWPVPNAVAVVRR